MPSLELASIDDFLGPRESRFLGEGFQRVEHSLSDLTVSPGDVGVGGIDATARVGIPGVWSRKGKRAPTPHLSTIDAMLFGAQLTGLYAAHAFGLGPDSRFAVQSVDLRAGSRPDEDDLAKFPVSGRLAAVERGEEEWSTALDCRIGSLSATVRARHGAGRAPAAAPGVYQAARELCGPWNDAAYGIPHDARRQLITAVRVSAHGPDDLRARGRIRLTPHRAGDAAQEAPATMIDAFVAAMQLGQVLLYLLDGVDRVHSNNLWMRRARVTSGDTPAGPADEVTAALEQPRLLRSPAGTWRTADVVGRLNGVRARAGVAHLLPESCPGGNAWGRSGR